MRYDYWLVKLDNSGKIQWKRNMGGWYDDMATSVQTTSDFGYIVAGLSNSNEGDVLGIKDRTRNWIVKLKAK